MMWRPISVLLLGLTLCACGERPAPQPTTAPAGDQQTAPVATAVPGQPAAPEQAAPPTEDTGRGLSLENKPWKGDFDAMLEHKRIRVLVPYSRTLYFLDKGQERGLTAETVRDFETYINKKYRKDKRPITVFIIPTTRDRLIDNVAAGIGDIAAGNITVTPSREKVVDFYAPDNQPTHDEIVVTGPNAPPLATIDDLAGKAVAVRQSSSHYESLVALNKRFAAERKPPVQIELLPDALETPDVLEMTDAGVLDIVVADNIEAKAWALALPNIKVREDLAVRSGTKIGWAIRKNSPQLAAALEDFRESHLIKQGVSAYRLAQFQKRFKRMGNPAQAAEYKRFQATLEIFRRYGPEYDFDPLMLAAQGFQESRLNQDAKSHVGAIGVMQIMPATGKELGVGDIRRIEANIHGGAKYLDKLMRDYFKDAKFDEQNRALFAFASYNAGPGRIQQMRKLAAERGLNPDVWFNNVEIVTADKVGMETTTYVRNIFKYYASYRLLQDLEAQKQQAAESLGHSPAVQ
jgi:membrane-bound lytic murein transglycosylase MltF